MEADGAPFTRLPLSVLRFTGIQSYGYTDQRKVETDVVVTEDRTGDLSLRKLCTCQLSHDCSSCSFTHLFEPARIPLRIFIGCWRQTFKKSNLQRKHKIFLRLCEQFFVLLLSPSLSFFFSLSFHEPSKEALFRKRPVSWSSLTWEGRRRLNSGRISFSQIMRLK